jgi:hypothetical protein
LPFPKKLPKQKKKKLKTFSFCLIIWPSKNFLPSLFFIWLIRVENWLISLRTKFSLIDMSVALLEKISVLCKKNQFLKLSCLLKCFTTSTCALMKSEPFHINVSCKLVCMYMIEMRNLLYLSVGNICALYLTLRIKCLRQ